jgi:hypothetical protein
MKRVLLAALVLLVVGVVVVVTVSSRRTPTVRFATPLECVETYRDAVKDGNKERMQSCVTEQLRGELGKGKGLDAVNRDIEASKSWGQQDPVIKDWTAHIDVDLVFPNETRLVRFHLERSAKGWLIKAIDPPRSQPAIIRYGTHVKDVPP